MRVPAIRRVERAEPRDAPVVHSALGNLIGGRPRRVVSHEGQRHPLPGIAAAVADDAVEPFVVFRVVPRAIGGSGLDRGEQASGTESWRSRGEDASEAIATAGDLQQRPFERVHVVDVGGASRREISFVRVVGSFLELHAAHQLGDQEVDVRPSLAMSVRRHVDGDSGDADRKVGPVIEVESAEMVPDSLCPRRCVD